jgi:hypothetical protein
MSLRQSANDPPLVMASVGGKQFELAEPDSALHGIWMAPTQVVPVKKRAGILSAGGFTATATPDTDGSVLSS